MNSNSTDNNNNIKNNINNINGIDNLNNNLSPMNNLITPPSSTIRNKVQDIIQNGTINIASISQDSSYNNYNNNNIIANNNLHTMNFQGNFINNMSLGNHSINNNDHILNNTNNGINMGSVTFFKNPPLSPTKSSPIQSTKAKRQRSEGSSRVNGSLSLDDIINSLIKRKQNGLNKDKPPYSYAILICLSILQSEFGKLTLSQIYHWISSNFPYFQLKDSSWQNSIRHNLSLNEGFVKTAKSSDGKGHFWQVKESSARKFFKHEERSYDEIRLQLRNLDLQLNNINTNNIMANTSNNNDTGNSINDGLQLAPPPPYLLQPNHPKAKLSQFGNSHGNDNMDSDMENDDLNSSDIEDSLNANRKINSMVELSSPPSYITGENDDIKIANISDDNNDQINGNEMNNTVNNNNTNNIGKINGKTSNNQTSANHSGSNKNGKYSGFLEPPYQLRRNHTSLGVSHRNTLLNDFPNEHDIFPQQNHLLLNDEKLINPITDDGKRYVSSFNSSFELSPNGNQTNDNKLDQLIMNNSRTTIDSDSKNNDANYNNIPKDTNNNNNNPHIIISKDNTNNTKSDMINSINSSTATIGNTSNNVQLIKNSNYQNADLLKTPIQEYRGFERTPILESVTPRDDAIINIHSNQQTNELMMKKWQTPSHLFEDTYSSPMLKAMGKTPIKLSSTPNGTIIKSPRKLSTPDLTTKAKLSYSGLFGVDVISVWQRALKDINSEDINNANNNNSSNNTANLQSKKGNSENNENNWKQ